MAPTRPHTQPSPRVAPRGEDVVRRLVADRPSFHRAHGEARIWHALPGTLAMITRRVSPGDRTLETGAGASTVVFAAAGAEHTAISPSADEHEAIRGYAEAQGIDVERLSFVADSSDRVLPVLPAHELDAAFIDGAHSFPHPVVDWHYISRRLRPGGTLMLDDVHIPAVTPLFRHMASEPACWELLEIVDDRAAAFRKLADPPEADDWRGQAINRGFPDYGFLPARARVRRELADAALALRAAAGRRLPRLKARLRG